MKNENHTISIYVEGGVVQDVDDVPPGITVRVVDYDNAGETDDTGEDCSIELYEGELTPTKPALNSLRADVLTLAEQDGEPEHEDPDEFYSDPQL